MAVTHSQPLTHSNLNVTAQPLAQASPISFSDNLRSLEMTVMDTLLVDSISSNVIKVEPQSPWL